MCLTISFGSDMIYGGYSYLDLKYEPSEDDFRVLNREALRKGYALTEDIK